MASSSSSSRPYNVFITGCSASSLGAGLATELQTRSPNVRVLASSRDPSKTSELRDLGIETLTLDILDPASIASCVEEVSRLTDGKLDMLINNAGGGYNMPISDIDIDTAKRLFDLNVWSQIAVTQAFLPLLVNAAKEGKVSSRTSSTSSGWWFSSPWSSYASPKRWNPQRQAMIVNNTSISSISLTPFNSVYHASKSAMAMMSAHLRLELAPFGIKVVDLKTGSVKTKFHSNRMDPAVLPEKGSLYEPVREEAERTMNGGFFLPTSMPVGQWARDVVSDLLDRRGGAPANVWRGRQAGRTWWEWTCAPTVEWFDRSLMEGSGLGKLTKLLAETEIGISS